ncbi:MAG: SAM-dependent methyltransferase [Labedaea sp.]
MGEWPAWVPEGMLVDVPSAARVYDYLLGGGHNFPADRAVGDQVLRVLPNGGQIAGSNRAFLRRAVLYMISQGITQFLDLGSGIPTVGNVHEIAEQASPDARVVYVDHDGVAVAHSELLLSDDPRATVVAADFTKPDEVLDAGDVARMLDFSRPIGLLMVAVLHFVPDEKDPRGLVARFRDELAPGSLVALSHLTADHKPEQMAAVTAAMRNSRDPMYFRPHDEFAALFEGLTLVSPGVVSAPHWRPEPGSHTVEGPDDVYVGVGLKP